ncbi:MAG: hypothetical protein O9301_16720 [Leptospira sp.]|nr:hypothetical protein [Leptospira sp.]
MSLCHPENGGVSCGACCGLFNLKVSIPEYKEILKERTEQFKSTVNFEVRHSFPIYRKSREETESIYPKKDDSTYNCPFLGYVDESDKKIGCMIHPIFTKDPKSQNFSFYGTSICQTYDCKNKESEISKEWEDLFLEVSDSSTTYSLIASDHIFATAIEKYFYHKKIEQKEMFGIYREFLKDLYKLRKETISEKNFTSFEINFENFSDLKSCEDYLKHELGLSELGWKEKSPDRNGPGDSSVIKLLL